MTKREIRAATLAGLIGGVIVIVGFLIGALTMPVKGSDTTNPGRLASLPANSGKVQ